MHFIIIPTYQAKLFKKKIELVIKGSSDRKVWILYHDVSNLWYRVHFWQSQIEMRKIPEHFGPGELDETLYNPIQFFKIVLKSYIHVL